MCKYEFCWLCLGDYDNGNHFYDYNSPCANLIYDEFEYTYEFPSNVATEIDVEVISNASKQNHTGVTSRIRRFFNISRRR